MTEPSPQRTLIDQTAAWGGKLAAERADVLLAYLDAMLLLNEQINLTAVRDPAAALVLHALDGLAFARTGLHPQHLLDIGSGNGFPGVAIAALHPGASVVLMDRTAKKVRAIGSCLVTAKLDGAETLNLDAQQAPGLRRELRHAFDCITARAVGTPEMLAELADPLLRPGGHLVLWLDAAAEVPERIGPFRRAALLGYDLPEPAARHRQLGVWQKRA